MRGRGGTRTRSTSMTRRGVAAAREARGAQARTRALGDARRGGEAPAVPPPSSSSTLSWQHASSLEAELQQLSDDYYGAPAAVAVACTPPAQHHARSLAGTDEYVCAGPGRDGSSSNSSLTRWRRGPSDTAGRCFDASGRNLLCMDVHTQTGMRSDNDDSNGRYGVGARMRSRTSTARDSVLCVVGSADHGLRVFDVVTLRAVAQLYGARYGHTEWVTACKFLPGARVLSGGMDSKLCLWSTVTRPGPARCVDLLGHTGSVSQIEVSASGTRAVSASYDRTLRVWNCDADTRAGALACMAGHEAAVTAFAWSSTCREVVSADRRGGVRLWDVATATCIGTLSSSERRGPPSRATSVGSGDAGPLGAVAHADFGDSSASREVDKSGGGSHHLTLLGDQRGVVSVVDWRVTRHTTASESASAVVAASLVHAGGVVSGIRVLPGAAHYVVTCGADKRIALLDARRNLDTVHVFADHTDYIYALETHGPLVLSGGGNGWLLVHDTTTLQCCYGLGASSDAVRAIYASDSHLVAACDDGKAMVYDYDANV